MKSYDFLLTSWLPMIGILVKIWRISRKKFKCNYLKNQKTSLDFSLGFWNVPKFRVFWKKDQSHSLSNSEIIDFEKGGYLNVEMVLFQATFRPSTS